jgi:hypothetical protein
MRKILTSAMVAGAALMVAACGGGETEANNTAATDLGNDMSMDANMTDMGMDANMTDMNMTTTDTNVSMDATNGMSTTTTTTETNTSSTNGM